MTSSSFADETPEARDVARERGYRERVLQPSERAQIRYPLSEHPCSRCENEGLPRLTDNGCEFGWEHGPGGGRSGCPRFGRNEFCCSGPRPGTATSLWKGYGGRYRPRSEDEYLRALAATENGADDAWKRTGL